MTTEISRHGVIRGVQLTVLVAASADPDGLSRTREALNALIATRHLVEYLVVDGFEGATWNRAMNMAHARSVAFVEAGLVPDATWYQAALAALARHSNADAVAAAVIDSDSGIPVYRSAGIAFTGHFLADGEQPREVTRTAVLGRSWVVRRDRLRDVGGFDEFTKMPYGLADLGWRFWLVGHGAVFDPNFQIVGTTSSMWSPNPGDPIRAEMDAAATIFRNLDERNLSVAFPAAEQLSGLRSGGDPGVAAEMFERIRCGLEAQRRSRQAERIRPDAEVVRTLGPALEPDNDDDAFRRIHAEVVSGLGDDHSFAGRNRVAVITADTLGERMAGPGIRAMRIAERLAQDHHVILASTTMADLDGHDFEISVVDPKALAALVEWADVIVFQGWVFAGNRAFDRTDRVFLVDVYDPMHLEQLEQARDLGDYGRLDAVRRATAALNEQLVRGDSFFCASGKQRDFWLGQLAALGRINPAVYDDDPSLERLITTVPFGISDETALRTRPALKGVVPGIGPHDRVILWGGGVYNWFDPLTLINAVDRLRTRCDDVRLVFLGMRHPNPDIPEMRMAVETRKLAERLGLVGKHVFFNEEWVAYEDRHNFLLDADVAVTTHLHHIETEFSFRTRVLDYFWTGLPTVATSGDSLADLIDQRRLGLTVPPGDVEALENALFELLENDEFRSECHMNVEAVRSTFVWSNILEPIAECCADPRRAPDLVAGIVGVGTATNFGQQLLQTGLKRDLQMAVHHLREQGPAVVAEKVVNRIRRRLR